VPSVLGPVDSRNKFLSDLGDEDEWYVLVPLLTLKDSHASLLQGTQYYIDDQHQIRCDFTLCPAFLLILAGIGPQWRPRRKHPIRSSVIQTHHASKALMIW
jgi:hypothetical protein